MTGIRIRIGGRLIPYQTQPFILGGRTLSHIRPLAEAMGATVAWDDASQMVTLTAGGRTAQCQVGSEVGLVNGQGYFLDEPPVFVGQHVVVPVRFVAEALGYRADYDPGQKLVTLTLN